MTNYPFHELCMIFPPCNDAELESLRESVEKNGLIEPVTMFDGKVLDGRNRMTVCLMLGIDPPTVEYTGDDPVAFVLSKNLHRRHLDASQRAMIAARIANLPPHRPNKCANLRSVPSQDEASEMMNVSRRQTQAAKKILKEADETTIKEIESGNKSVSKAAKELKSKKSGLGQSVKGEDSVSGLPNEVFGEGKDTLADTARDSILISKEMGISIVASIRLIAREIEKYCDAAMPEMIEESIPRFIEAFCDLFDAKDIKKVLKGKK